MSENEDLWRQQGGSGPRTALLLHGLGATSAVWTGLQPLLEQRGMRWIAPDLTGHGLSPWHPHYSTGQLAAGVAPLVQDCEDLYIVGHSLGVYVALALASRWFGVRVAGVLGIGPKVTWSEADLKAGRDLATRPVRSFAQEAEALTRYRRMSGLEDKIAPDAVVLERGVTQIAEGFRLSQDPRTFVVGGAPFATLVASADAKLLLARGEFDAMVSLAELREHVPNAVDVAAAGHNVHVENPTAVANLLDSLVHTTTLP